MDRQGESDHHNLILAKFLYLLRRKNVCVIFPEGGRSRSGRIEPENVQYGVGRMIQELGECRVICIYQRGEKFKTLSVQPPGDDNYHIVLEAVHPRTDVQGYRGARDISRQIINKLKEMEDAWFASRPDRSSGK